MTAEFEYYYLGNDFVLRIGEEVMSRAVRVKVAVKDKIERVFNNSVSNLLSAAPASPSVELEAQPVQVETGLSSLIDISDENLHTLNDKLNAMQNQDNVTYVVKRAVLFTKGLVTKIENVTSKWFEGMPIVEKKVEVSENIPNVEIANQLSGEVIPGTWFNANENTLNHKMEVEPQGELNVPLVQANEEPKFEMPAFAPNFGENMLGEKEEIAIKGGENMPVEGMNEQQMDVQEQTFDFVPEPSLVGEVEAQEYVPEPSLIQNDEVSEKVELPSEEAKEEVAPIEMELPATLELPQVELEETTIEPEKAELPSEEEPQEKLSIEDKIAELLRRKREMHEEEPEMEVTKFEEAEANEEQDKSMRFEKPELTQAAIMARLQRINNSMKEKDATIRSLTAKNESAKEEVAEAKEKINGYEAVVNDLTMKNNSLTQENERLSAKIEDAKSASQSRISKLEEQVDELTAAKAKESEASKKAISDLKAKQESEIAKLKAKHAKELEKVTAASDRKVLAIYQTLEEALPELLDEYDSGPKLAA